MDYMRYSRDPVVGSPELGVLFFGFFYLMYRGLWFHTFMMLFLAIPTLGLVWVWYIFKTRRYLTKKLFFKGYFNDQWLSDRIINITVNNK